MPNIGRGLNNDCGFVADLNTYAKAMAGESVGEVDYDLVRW